MIKSSIVVPSHSEGSSLRKRPIDQDESGSSNNGNNDHTQSSRVSEASEGPAEVKRPRLDLNADNKQRGQRMFNVLLGTLNKFKDESMSKSEAEKKRREIDSKLQEKLENEKREIAEKVAEERERREREIALLRQREKRILEEKIDSTCVQQKEYVANYIKTKTEPVLYYRPKKLTEEMEKQIEEQKELAKQERKAYEERRDARKKEAEEEESKHKAVIDEALKRQEEEKRPNEDDEQQQHQQQNGSPRLESPTPEEAVADKV